MRPQLEAVEALLAESEQRALDLPHRTHYLLLAQSLGRHLVAAYRAWIAQVEHELSDARPIPRASNGQDASRASRTP
jgi:hypothetical protein